MDMSGNMSGKFRDVIRAGNKVIEDSGWRFNSINEDFGKFLAALLKGGKDGITSWEFYIAIGKTSNDNSSERTETFRNNIISFFGEPNKPYVDAKKNWAWAKKITPDMIVYLLPDGTSSNSITNKLRIVVNFELAEPDSSTWELTEFSLLAKVEKPVSSTRELTEFSSSTKVEIGIYLMNYAIHGTITKSNSMNLDRTVVLTFPLNGS